MHKLLQRIRRLWWRMKPRPCTMEPDGFEKLVKWCARGEQNEVIETLGHIEK